MDTKAGGGAHVELEAVAAKDEMPVSLAFSYAASRNWSTFCHGRTTPNLQGSFQDGLKRRRFVDMHGEPAESQIEQKKLSTSSDTCTGFFSCGRATQSKL